MAGRIGLILSALAIVAGFVYAAQEPERYPDLAWLYDLVAMVGVVAALAVIWIGVGLVALLGRYRRKRETY